MSKHLDFELQFFSLTFCKFDFIRPNKETVETLFTFLAGIAHCNHKTLFARDYIHDGQSMQVGILYKWDDFLFLCT